MSGDTLKQDIVDSWIHFICTVCLSRWKRKMEEYVSFTCDSCVVLVAVCCHLGCDMHSWTSGPLGCCDDDLFSPGGKRSVAHPTRMSRLHIYICLAFLSTPFLSKDGMQQRTPVPKEAGCFRVRSRIVDIGNKSPKHKGSLLCILTVVIVVI